MSVVMVPCCAYVVLLKRMVVKMCNFLFYFDTCVCKYLHTLLVSAHIGYLSGY
jgi:hypothetical protein